MTLIQQPTLDPRQAIAAGNERFMASFARQDAERIAALYTEGGQLLPTGSEPVQERAAIRRFWQGLMDLGAREARLQTVELESFGDTAYEVGRYTISGEGGQEIDRGKYLVVWKQEQGAWKLHRDIWNSSLPPAR